MDKEYYDLPGTPSLIKIRNTFKEYFTYDPRGNVRSWDNITSYCSYCKCPSEYCAEKMFGKMCSEHTQQMIDNDKVNIDYDIDDVNEIFGKVYSEAIHAKLLINKIEFYFVDLNNREQFTVPKCVRKNSLRNLLTKFRAIVRVVKRSEWDE